MDSVGQLTRRSGTRSWKEAEEIRRKAIDLKIRGERYDTSSAIATARDQSLLNLTQAANQTGRTKEAIQEMIDQGRLPATCFGKNVFVNRTDLKAI